MERCIWMISLITVVVGSSCTSDDENNEHSTKSYSNAIEITEGWARPGLEGKSSAGYVKIVNNTSVPDTLKEVYSQEAGKAEIHVTVEDEKGIIQMSHSGEQVIKPEETLHLKPSDIHIMLMDLTRDLAPGDSISLTFEFSQSGRIYNQIPISATP